MNTEEILDLVNEDDEVIGQKSRREIYDQDLRNYRVVNAFIVNSEGKLWIPRRTANKALAPLGLDMSMGGHVESGETYEQSFAREMQEELGIDVNVTSYRLLGHLTPYKDDIHCFMKVYEIRSDEVPRYNPEDFVEYFWLTPVEILDRIAAGDKAKGDLPRLVKRFYSN